MKELETLYSSRQVSFYIMTSVIWISDSFFLSPVWLKTVRQTGWDECVVYCKWRVRVGEMIYGSCSMFFHVGNSVSCNAARSGDSWSNVSDSGIRWSSSPSCLSTTNISLQKVIRNPIASSLGSCSRTYFSHGSSRIWWSRIRCKLLCNAGKIVGCEVHTIVFVTNLFHQKGRQAEASTAYTHMTYINSRVACAGLLLHACCFSVTCSRFYFFLTVSEQGIK